MLKILKPVSFTQSLFLFQLLIFHYKFLFSQENAVRENRLCTMHDGAGSEEWCSWCESIPQQSRQIQALRSLRCYPIRRAPHLGHRGMPPPESLCSGESVTLNGFITPTSCLSGGRHRASNHNEWIRISHLPVLHNHSRISMAQSHHPIVNHQRKLGGSSWASRGSHDKVLDLWQISGVLLSDKEKFSQHVHLNVQFYLP